MQSVEWYRERMVRPSSLTDAEKASIREDWREVMGVDFAVSFNLRCPNCYHDAAILIMRKMDNKNNSGYILKKGIVVRFQGKLYSDDNITDKAAEAYIREDLSRREDFITLAKEWEEYENGTTL